MKIFYPAKNSGQIQGVKCYTLKEVKNEAKSHGVYYVKIVKVDGGWLAFENWDDYRTWKSQK